MVARKYYHGTINFNLEMSKERINVFIRIKPTNDPSVWRIISPEEIVLNEPGKIPFSFSLLLFFYSFDKRYLILLNIFLKIKYILQKQLKKRCIKM